MGTVAGSEENVGLDQAKKELPPRPSGSRADRVSLGAPRPEGLFAPFPVALAWKG